jgi:hypothetical protein
MLPTAGLKMLAKVHGLRDRKKGAKAPHPTPDSALQFAPHAMASADPANRPSNCRICTPSYRCLKLASHGYTNLTPVNTHVA